MKISRFPIFVLLLALSGCAANQPPPVPAWQHDAVQQIDAAATLAANKQLADAETTIQTVIHSKNFAQLPDSNQYRALKLAATLAYTLKHIQLEYESRSRLVALSEATSQDRMQRLNTAARLADTGEIVVSLIAVAQKDPDRLSDINERFIFRVEADAKKKLPPDSTQALLQALYTAGWKLKYDIEPSYQWADLTLMLLQQNKLTEAIDVASHVTNEYTLITMRADRRFDAVVAASSARFDLDAAARQQLERYQSAMELDPKALSPRVAVIDLLLKQQHYAASLAMIDSLLAEIQATTDPKKSYEDYDRMYVWILDDRSRVLRRLRRWDEAVTQMTAASLVEEQAHGNVSQVINLGDLYCDLSRPKDALESLNRLGHDISAYGSMQAESVRLEAAVQLKDAEQTAKSLNYLSDHRTDAPRTYEGALLLVNKEDEAAQSLIGRLEDEDQRSAALLSIQEFALPPLTPQETAAVNHRRALINRPDVQAEVKKVGRIERYKLEALQQ